MLQVGLKGNLLAIRAIKDFFGPENYGLFKRACKREAHIPEEDRQRVDREVYDKVTTIVGISRRSGEGLWNQAIEEADRTVNYARRILFADQERQATLITNIASGDRRPSSVLEILTTPTKFISEQFKYEQGRQLALALLCAEIISGDENGHSRKILSEINRVLETKFFSDTRKGDPKPFHTFSYHTPGTNRLVGLSNQYPDIGFAEGLWVKSLDYPVRTISLRSVEGERSSVQALYDPREKHTESGVIKALQRSLKAAKAQSNGGVIKTSPYGNDRLGFRVVVMGGHSLRDMVITDLENLFEAIDGIDLIQNLDHVRTVNGLPDRVQFRRKQFHIRSLNRPLEVIVQTLPDYVAYQYEVGDFDPDLGMHNGQAWDLYKLKVVADVAPHLWSPEIFGIDLEAAKKSASYEYSTRLGRKQRIHPLPYPDFVA